MSKPRAQRRPKKIIIIFGGTGIRSELPHHPQELPLRHEAGTPNIHGFSGLRAAAEYLLQTNLKALSEQRNRITNSVRNQIMSIPGLKLLPLPNNDGRAGIVSFTLKNMPPAEATFVLQNVFHLTSRPGLHCAPLIHRHLGTWPEGTIRLSFGVTNSPDIISKCVEAASSLAEM